MISANDRAESIARTIAVVLAFLICCFVVALIAYSQGSQNERHSVIAHQHTDYYEDIAKRACAGLSSDAMFDCVQSKVMASDSTARAEQELSAQQRSAESTVFAALVSALTLVVSGIGVWYVKRTLDATLIAVKDASDATREMQKANEIARDVHISSSRPWLAVEDVSVDLYMQQIGDENIIFANLACITKNYGVSPAVCVFVNPTIQVGEYFVPDPGVGNAFEQQFRSAPGFGDIIYPNDSGPTNQGVGTVLSDNMGYFFIRLFIGVSYKMPGNDRTFFTGRIYTVAQQGSHSRHMMAAITRDLLGPAAVFPDQYGDVII